MARPRVTDGGNGPQMCRVATNIVSYSRNSPPFMEPEGSFPCSLVPSKHKPTDLCNWDVVCFLGGRNREK
jgi:hypothetical protein